MNYRILFLFIAAFAFLASCKKNDDSPKYITYAGGVDVINASNNSLNFYVNGTRQNDRSTLGPNARTGYLTTIPSGAQNFQFKKAGQSDILFSAPFTIKANARYSVFVTGETGDQTFITPDTGSFTADSVAMIRFVNASANTDSLGLSIAGDTVKFTNVAYKTATNYLPVPVGSKAFKIYRHGSTTPSINGTFTFVAGTIYTLYSRQLYNTTGNMFTVSFMTN